MTSRDNALEVWLRDEIGPTYDALKGDPSRGVTIEQLRARLAAEHEKASAKT